LDIILLQKLGIILKREMKKEIKRSREMNNLLFPARLKVMKGGMS
jgi:hypothetical protein